MIKRISFAADPPPGGLAPDRTVLCTVLPELTPDPFCDLVRIDWFSGRPPLPGAGDRPLTGAAAEVVVAEELVLRGGDWLERRWRRRGDALKHMAFARRADGLSPDEFSERWRDHAGRLGATPIPDVARGLAYVQNHPVPLGEGEWAYDAVNEVWFDDLDALRRRVEWFEENDAGKPDDLFGPSRFLAVREAVVT